MSAKLKKKFDLDGGYIIESPCRNCSLINQLPECSNSCKKLIQVHRLLTGTISCSNNISEFETYSLCNEMDKLPNVEAYSNWTAPVM
jgi:hypothetical protein